MGELIVKYITNPPNAISIFRLIVVLPIAIGITGGEFAISFAIFVVAAISDGLDGFLARRFGWETAFGKVIDPVADKLLLLVTTITLALSGHFPVMVMLLMVAKDLAVVLGVLVYTALAGFPELRPIAVGKVTTVLQLVLIGYVLLTLAVEIPLNHLVTPVLIWIVVVTTILDGCGYLWLWTGKLVRDPRWLAGEANA